MVADISVLMSVYYKEKPEYIRQCFDSLLNQTLQANEWVIVEDGKLTDEIYAILDEYTAKYPSLLKRIPLTKNRGLGLALREGVPQCSNAIIARMDTDDIARKDRFEKQYAQFVKNPELDICGSYIKEFEGTINNIVSKRAVPLTDAQIKEYQKKRDAFNHMTVMYRKGAVLRAGNYQSCLLMEDTLLWVHMIQSGARCMNLPECLVYARVGMDMYDRRGGLDYYKKYKMGRKKILDTGYISKKQYVQTLIAQFIVCIVPNTARKWIFNSLLRNQK